MSGMSGVERGEWSGVTLLTAACAGNNRWFILLLRRSQCLVSVATLNTPCPPCCCWRPETLAATTRGACGESTNALCPMGMPPPQYTKARCVRAPLDILKPAGRAVLTLDLFVDVRV